MCKIFRKYYTTIEVEIHDNMESFSEEVLVLKLEEVMDMENYNVDCKNCKRLVITHWGEQVCKRFDIIEGDNYSWYGYSLEE